MNRLTLMECVDINWTDIVKTLLQDLLEILNLNNGNNFCQNQTLARFIFSLFTMKSKRILLLLYLHSIGLEKRFSKIPVQEHYFSAEKNIILDV